jgi:hypothetical protein
MKLDLGHALIRQHRFTEAMEAFQAAERGAASDTSQETFFRIQIGVGQALTGLRQFDLAQHHLERGRSRARLLPGCAAAAGTAR